MPFAHELTLILFMNIERDWLLLKLAHRYVIVTMAPMTCAKS